MGMVGIKSHIVLTKWRDLKPIAQEASGTDAQGKQLDDRGKIACEYLL